MTCSGRRIIAGVTPHHRMKTKLEIRPLATPEEMARVAAREWIGLLKRRGDLSIPFGVALSGGRIARSFYEATAAAVQGAEDFEAVHFFWADERCVPPSSGENNFAIAQEELFAPLKIGAENIHRIRGEADPAYAVREAEAEICRILPLSEKGQPILDLVFLGMGEDGHVASLFPEEEVSAVQDERVYRRVRATKPPPERITLGYQPLIEAREVWVLASGRGKTEALQRLEAGDERLPICRVVSRRAKTIVFREAP